MVRGRVHELRYLVEIPIPYVDRRGRAVDPRKRLMKPAPAIPKTLEAKVARVARHLRKAPRLVLKEAIDEYVARHDPEAVTEAMNRVELLDTRPDPGVAGAARRVLERTEW